MNLFFRMCFLICCIGCAPEPSTLAFSASTEFKEPSWSWNQPCPSNFTCHYLPITLQHQAQTQSTYLYYAIRPAPDQTNKLGTLVINPGGPGHEGVQFVSEYLIHKLNFIHFGSFFSKSFFDRFDIIGFDPIGTGKSGFAMEIRQCLYLYTQYPQEQQTCFHMAPYISTNNTVKAIEQLRQHLDQQNLLIDGQIDLLGISYGTTLFSTYAHLYPQRVRSLILDSPTWPKYKTWLEMVRQDAADYVKSLEYIYANNQQNLVEINQQYEQSSSQQQLYQLEALILDIKAATQDNEMYKFAGLGYINCLDQQHPYQLSKHDLTNQTEFKIVNDLLYEYAKLCSGWYSDKTLLNPIWPVGFEIPIEELPPILILANTYDLKTPLGGAIARHALYPNSKLVEILNSTQHGISFNNNLYYRSYSKCANNEMLFYLEDPASLQTGYKSCELKTSVRWEAE